MSIITVGIDLAKCVFAVHGVNDSGKAALVKPKAQRADLLPLIAQLPPCLIGMEVCSGAHHWARLFRQYGSHGQTDAAMTRWGGALWCGNGRHAPPPATGCCAVTCRRCTKVRRALSHDRQARQERCGGCRRDLRGSHSTDYAFRPGQGRTPTNHPVPAPLPAGVRRGTHRKLKPSARSGRRIRYRAAAESCLPAPRYRRTPVKLAGLRQPVCRRFSGTRGRTRQEDRRI